MQCLAKHSVKRQYFIENEEDGGDLKISILLKQMKFLDLLAPTPVSGWVSQISEIATASTELVFHDDNNGSLTNFSGIAKDMNPPS